MLHQQNSKVFKTEKYVDQTDSFFDLMEYITLCLDSTNEAEQWYVRHSYFIVLYHRMQVSTHIQVIFRPSFTGKSIKCYTCWGPIMLVEVK